ncbi:hypothetical protein pipiens_000735, partial [Culex pipiens pipiens]
MAYAGRSIVQRSEIVVLESEDRVTQIIETDPEDATFRFKITWSKSSSSANQPKTVNGCDNERYSLSVTVHLLGRCISFFNLSGDILIAVADNTHAAHFMDN